MIDSLPSFAVESIREAMPYLGRKLKGFDDDNAVDEGGGDEKLFAS